MTNKKVILVIGSIWFLIGAIFILIINTIGADNPHLQPLISKFVIGYSFLGLAVTGVISHYKNRKCTVNRKGLGKKEQ